MYQIQLVGDNGTYQTIYDQSQMNTYSVVGPKYEFEINEAGSLSFTLVFGHPLYDLIKPLESFVRAVDNGEEIFYGRVIQKSAPTLSGQITYTCEGALSFLLDSEIAPFGKDNRGNPITRNMTAQEFFEMCIQQHNAEVDDPRREFAVGNITSSKKLKTEEYSITNYTQTKSAIESNILNVYGGFIRVREGNNRTHIIDWLENYPHIDPQPITIGVNLEEQTNESDGSSMYTVIRPIGADGIMLQEGTLDLYSAEDIARMGRIVKTIEFKNAENESQLLAEAQAYIGDVQKTLFDSCSIQLVDTHYLDGTYPKIRGGDRFTNIQGFENQEMVAGSLELDFEHPENDSLTLKNRKSLDPDMTPGGGRGKTKRSRGGGGGGGGGVFLKYILESQDTVDIIANTVNMHGLTLIQHYEDILQTGNDIRTISSRVDDIDDYVDEAEVKFNDITYRVQTVEGTAVIQNSQSIAELSGNFELWTDPITHKVTVHLKDGAEIAVDDASGGTITVGERIAQNGTDIEENKAIIDTIRGSALWTTRDQITGICGEYDIEYVDGKKVLVVKSGGGMKIREDNVEYGIYHDGNLDGGLIVQKLNNDRTGALITADHINLSAVNGRIDAVAADVMLEVSNALDEFYVQVIADAEHLVVRTGDNTKTYKSNTEPTGTQEEPLVDGDLWFKGDGAYTWGDAAGGTWLEDVTNTWGRGLTSEAYRYNGSAHLWEKVVDAAAVLQDSRFDISKERVDLLSARVDVINNEYHVHYANLKVENDRIRSTVSDNYNGLSSRITQTADTIRLEVRDRANGLESNITQTASQIRAEVRDTENRLSASITVQANKIAMVVNGDGTIKAAQIVASINNGSSSVLISADHVNLDGYVRATDITSNYLYAKITALDRVSVNSLTSDRGGISVNTVGTNSLTFGGVDCYLPNSVSDLQIVQNGNNYTLQKKTFGNQSWTNVSGGTFSRATTLSGGWSGNKYTVTASPQGNSIETTTFVSTPTWGTGADVNKATVSFYYFLNGTRTEILPAVIDASARYNAGSPASGTASGRSGSSYNWTFAIKKGDGTTKNLTIDASNIYSDARSGYTQGIFRQASVTLQGSQQSVYVEASSGGTDYYTAGSSVYRAGDRVSRNRYGAVYDIDGNMIAYGSWFYVSSYDTAYLYHRGSSVTPINSSSKKHLLSTIRYSAGTTDTTHYYTKS